MVVLYLVFAQILKSGWWSVLEISDVLHMCYLVMMLCCMCMDSGTLYVYGLWYGYALYFWFFSLGGLFVCLYVCLPGCGVCVGFSSVGFGVGCVVSLGQCAVAGRVCLLSLLLRGCDSLPQHYYYYYYLRLPSALARIIKKRMKQLN